MVDYFRRAELVEARDVSPFDRLCVTVDYSRRAELVEARDVSPFDGLRVTEIY